MILATGSRAFLLAQKSVPDGRALCLESAACSGNPIYWNVCLLFENSISCALLPVEVEYRQIEDVTEV